MRDAVIQFCQSAGANPLLVQGAGGNVSWKEQDTLWVKASGTWLADAGKKDIFIPVDLEELRKELKIDNFSVQPRVLIKSTLKPSIETVLHALMPQKVVMHLHSVDAVAHLIQHDAADRLENLLGKDIVWDIVPYKKPGANLARAIKEVLNQRRSVDALFLKNHGLVVGANSVNEAKNILDFINKKLLIKKIKFSGGNAQYNKSMPIKLIKNYRISSANMLHQFVLNPELKGRLEACWAICPDHVVFLGKSATIIRREDLEIFCAARDLRIPVIFVEGHGAFERTDITHAEKAQIKFYVDTMSRVGNSYALEVLSEEEANELVNWEAENYRRQLNFRSVENLSKG